VYQQYAVDFFWGKSFPMRLMARQDFLNVMYNMMRDRTYMSLMPAFLTSIEDEIEEDEIGPLQRIKVADPSSVRELSFQSVGAGDVNIMQMTLDSLSRTANIQGVSGLPSDATATAVLQAREAAVNTLGMLMKFMAWMTYRQTRQRISNILQFYPSQVEEGMKEARLEEATLSDGTVGVKIIRLISSKDDQPTQARIDEEVLSSDIDNIEIKYITPQELSNVDSWIRIVPNSSIAESKTLNTSRVNEAIPMMLNMFGPIIAQKPGMIDKLAQLMADNNDLDLDFMEEGEGSVPPEIQGILEQMQDEQMSQGGAEQPTLPTINRQTAAPSTKSVDALLRG
jgi:hypothetical protein